jgi:copper transporter 1
LADEADVLNEGFLASSWRIENAGMFAASCIGVILLVICLQGFHRLSKEYDLLIHRQWTTHANQQSEKITDSASMTTFTYRVSPIQQLIRAVLHAFTFGLAYILMLIAMSYNGYLIICIIIGAGLGKFLCDWSTITIDLYSAQQTDSSIKQSSLPCLCYLFKSNRSTFRLLTRQRLLLL